VKLQFVLQHKLHADGEELIRVAESVQFVFKEFLSGIQKGKTIFYPKFQNGLFIQENRARSVAECVCCAAVHTL
jgi:hypothetical protein